MRSILNEYTDCKKFESTIEILLVKLRVEKYCARNKFYLVLDRVLGNQK